MKFNMKAVAATVLFAVAGSSQAAILDGFSSSEDGTVFVSIFRDTATPESMIVETPVSVFGLRDGTTTSWSATSAQQAAIQAFLQTADISSFRFNAGAVTSQADPFDQTANQNYGAVISGNAMPFGYDSAGLGSLRANIDTFETQINNAYPAPANDVITGLSPTSLNNGAGYHNAFAWGSNVGGVASGYNTEGQVGTQLPIWYVYNGNTDFLGFDTAYRQLASFNINTSTGALSLSAMASSVPVPAAAWLLGSGMIGLVGVARRKAS